eukprot:4357985-Alexandrium_andersonii.AAC.1
MGDIVWTMQMHAERATPGTCEESGTPALVRGVVVAEVLEPERGVVEGTACGPVGLMLAACARAG